MFRMLRKLSSKTTLALTLTLLGVTPALPDDSSDGASRHVLLISIDGMHALDFENCVSANTCPNLKALGRTGVSYTGPPPPGLRIRFPD
jgi:hypothetical protein